eukprot:Opistho-2@12360
MADDSKRLIDGPPRVTKRLSAGLLRLTAFNTAGNSDSGDELPPSSSPKAVKPARRTSANDANPPMRRQSADCPQVPIMKAPLEEYADIVYHVILQRVQHFTPSASESVGHLAYSTQRRKRVKGATIDRLVQNLLPSTTTPDSHYVNVFLVTYRTFTDPDTLLSLVRARFSNPAVAVEALDPACHLADGDVAIEGEGSTAIDTVHLSILTVLTIWVTQYAYDFAGPSGLARLHQVCEFIEGPMRNALPPTQSTGQIEKAVRGLIADKERVLKSVPPPIAPKPGAGAGEAGRPLSMHRQTQSLSSIALFANAAAAGGGGGTGHKRTPSKGDRFAIRSPWDGPLTAADIAAQLTLVEAACFRGIVPFECLGCGWSKKDKLERAPGICASIQQFNRISMLVMTDIIDGTEPILRARSITRFIEIANETRILRNYATLKAVLSGLQSTPVHRLKRSWALVPKEARIIFDELSEIMSEDSNMKRSREVLAASSPPCLPYLGTFLTDLTMIDTANGDFLGDGKTLINFDKRRKEFEIIEAIVWYQKAASFFRMEPNAEFQKFLAFAAARTEDECYRLSLEREPKDVPGMSVPEDSPESIIANMGLIRDRLRKFIASRPNSKRAFIAKHQFLGTVDAPEAEPAVEKPMPTQQRLQLLSEEKDPHGIVLRVSLFNKDSGDYKTLVVPQDATGLDVILLTLEKYNMDVATDGLKLLLMHPNGETTRIHGDVRVGSAIPQGSDSRFVIKEKTWSKGLAGVITGRRKSRHNLVTMRKYPDRDAESSPSPSPAPSGASTPTPPPHVTASYASAGWPVRDAADGSSPSPSPVVGRMLAVDQSTPLKKAQTRMSRSSSLGARSVPPPVPPKPLKVGTVAESHSAPGLGGPQDATRTHTVGDTSAAAVALHPPPAHAGHSAVHTVHQNASGGHITATRAASANASIHANETAASLGTATPTVPAKRPMLPPKPHTTAV